jgi:hypothetical protein
MSEKCECGFGYGENEFPDECDECGEYFCPKCMRKHKKECCKCFRGSGHTCEFDEGGGECPMCRLSAFNECLTEANNDGRYNQNMIIWLKQKIKKEKK